MGEDRENVTVKMVNLQKLKHLVGPSGEITRRDSPHVELVPRASVRECEGPVSTQRLWRSQVLASRISAGYFTFSPVRAGVGVLYLRKGSQERSRVKICFTDKDASLIWGAKRALDLFPRLFSSRVTQLCGGFHSSEKREAAGPQTPAGGC